MTRIEIEAEDYFLHQKKKLDLSDRRPVARKASDLVGPGIDYAAVPINDFNDLLATYNGYYSAQIGALNAPKPNEAFLLNTTMDENLGGVQKATSFGSNLKPATGVEYRRIFVRNSTDPETIYWSPWATSLYLPDTDWIDCILGNGWVPYDAERTPQYCRMAGRTYFSGLVKGGNINTTITAVPAGFRARSRRFDDHHFPVGSNNAFGLIGVNAATGELIIRAGSGTWIDLSGVHYKVEA